MNLLFPTFKLKFLPAILGISVLGAAIAGFYGVLHDQITYSLSGEYFTRLKFYQFHYADFGFPTRIFVAEIGFLATWWTGFVSGWFLARIAVPAWPVHLAIRRSCLGFALIFLAAFIFALVGYFLGVNHSGNYSYWADMCRTLGVEDVPRFVLVAYIHNAGYIGGLLGLIAAIVLLLCVRKNARKFNRHSELERQTTIWTRTSDP